ncbi:PTHB1 N-terminus-domain-containing protein [Haematococcus lacustris]
MSLFKARDWWVTQCGSGAEEFDGGCLCLGNIDNDPHEAVKLATGSLSGILRIYQPKDRDFKPEDLLLEQELEQAILQLELGHFSSMEGMQLAVLHPRKLAVYLVRNMGTQYLQASKLYEHPMEHTAANMCFGPFGGVQGQDYICVQSYDGQLSFYECESFAFARYLPSFLIPGPLAYVAASDSFVTCSAGFKLECYKYKSLAAASGEKQAEGKPVGGANLQVGKRVTADWKVILGESAVDLRCGRLSKGLQAYQADIVVLCEHHVFVVSSTTGAIIFQKRLEYHPACCTTYPAAESKLPGGLENLLVASHNKALLVYRGNVLCWAARMDSQPVAVKVADISTSTGLQKGMLVTLTDTGGLQVSYLGTDPMLNPVGFVEGKDLDYEAMGREQRALATIIREHAQGKRVEPFDRLMMRAQVPAVFDHLRDGEGAGHEALSRPGSSSNNHEGGVGGLGPGRIRPQLTLRLIINYQGSASSLDSVTVTVKAPTPVSIMQDTFNLRNVKSDPNDPSIVPITFQAASATCLPASATALIVASFAAGNGEPRAQMLEVALPLCLFVTAVPAAKNAAYKITVSVNRAPPLLGALFKDMLALASPGVAQASASGAAGANVLTFQYPTGMTATILVSKNAARFRLQSDALEALWLVLSELVRRLREYYQAVEASPGTEAVEGPLVVTADEPLPLEDVMEVIDAHFAARQRVRELRRQLEERAVALRSIQKRLLMRFKDKAPAPLNQLDYLMEETYSGLMELGGLLDTAQGQVKQQAGKLSAAVQLLLLLASFKFGLQAGELAVLRSALAPEVSDGEDVGWEEATEASLTQLLRSCLARNAKEAAVPLPALAPAKDTSKLKKHLALVLERLSRGQRMVLEGEDAVLGAGTNTSGTAASSLARQVSRASSSKPRS